MMFIIHVKITLMICMMISCFAVEEPNRLPKVLSGAVPKKDFIAAHYRGLAAAAFEDWQRTYRPVDWQEQRERLKQLIIDKSGMKLYPELPVDVRVTRTIRQKDYVIKNIYFQSRPGIYATANLYLPVGEGPFPAVVVTHGHWPDARRSEIFQSVAQSLVQAGYVALTLDAWGAGERCSEAGIQEYHGANLGASLLNVGETLLGVQLTDNIRAVDLLSTLPEVDVNRIGATGASGGGNQVMWLAALDERIKAAIPVVSVGTFQSYVMNSNCVCELLPEGLTFTEESGVLGLVAPRALNIFNATKDTNPAFLPSEMLRTFDHAKQLFAAVNSEEKLNYVLFDTGHGYWPEMRLAMLNWFDRELKGTEEQRQEMKIEPMDATDLATFGAKDRDNNVMTTASFCRERGEALKDSLLTSASFSVQDKENQLLAILGKNEGSLANEILAFGEEDGWWKRALLTQQKQHIPFLWKRPKETSQLYRIFIHTNGKDSIALEAVRKAIDNGEHVILMDVWGTGEQYSFEAKKIDGQLPPFHTLSRSALWLGRTVMGEWVRDLEAMMSWIYQKGGKISAIEAHRETAIAALIFSIKHPVGSLALYHCPYSYQFDGRTGIDFYNMAVHLPGILKWGNVSLMTALSTAKVHFLNARSMSGSVLGNSGKREFEKEVASYCQKLNKEIQRIYWTE
ncbi:acetylxylan esterase [Olivibacter sp. SDN3]|uniref:alpha/beta hydrolase family protein n=1 Tax=Olivibacter sp. SDN3 TaxID=2764720 RepID=UPI0016512FB0|nr:acetylxylan esterase [Olivibacter sp. SDN3]QNL50398.1 acetylxylan esterase [Olivibacter sp. SDN3]